MMAELEEKYAVLLGYYRAASELLSKVIGFSDADVDYDLYDPGGVEHDSDDLIFTTDCLSRIIEDWENG